MFDGTPDETIDEDDQMWAISRIEEYVYRTHFHLTKKEMLEEPLEDIRSNMELMRLFKIKESREYQKSSAGGVR